MKDFLFRLYLKLMKLGAHFSKINPKEMVILNGAGRSGSNGYLFAKEMKKQHPDYEVTLVEPWPSAHLTWATWRKIGAAKYVLTTHQPFKIHARQVNVQLWHGIPLKRMGLMANNTSRRTDQRNAKLWQKNADLICSSSDLYETLMSACCAIETGKYQKVGFPRLDALKHSPVAKKQLLHDLFGQADEQAQIGIYLPTFRYEMADQQMMTQIKMGNFLTVADFDAEKLNQQLKQQHRYLIIKLHPYEQRLLEKMTSQYSQLVFLDNDYLVEHDYDLYELLGATDWLITDFSSVYFDYLALDRPIYFMTNHLLQYEKTRGLLLGPYQKVVPGYCIQSQAQLLETLNAPDKYHSQRQYWYNLTNQVQSSSYCADLFAMMTEHY